MRGAISGLLLLGLLGIAAPSAAELYRCRGADGQPRFTNDPASCAGAAPHEPRTRIQRIETPPAASSPQDPQRRHGDTQDLEAGQAALWRGRLREAERERDALRQEIERLSKLVTWCNRGGTVASTDPSGIRRQVSCEQVRSRWRQQEERLKQLQAYLREGIHEECRRAGCLPGWLR
jgi:hypothetical protein